MSARRHRVREASLAGVLLLGYLFAAGGSAIGQGWALAGHVATQAHAPEAPGLQPDLPTRRAEGFTTLRALAPEARGAPHAHGGAAHTHSAVESERPSTGRTVRVRAHEHAPEGSGAELESRVADGFHAHGDEIHRHDAPPADPAPVALTLDKHRLPGSPALAPVPVQAATWAMPSERSASAGAQVETPPPLARG